MKRFWLALAFYSVVISVFVFFYFSLVFEIMSCAAVGCKNARRLNLENVSFHRFPKGQLLVAWKKALKLGENWTWSANKFVCSKHFMHSDYIVIGNRSCLKLNAVPFLHAHICTSTKTSNVEQPHGSSSVLDSTTQDFNVTQSSIVSSIASSLKQSQSTDASEEKASYKSVVRKRKQVVRESPRKDTSASRSSSTIQRQSVKVIQSMHNYSTSPEKIYTKYILLKAIQVEERKQLYAAKRTIKKLKEKITNLNIVMKELLKQHSLSDVAVFHIEKC